MLPEKDGFTVLKELREQGITTPVLIITAKESLDDKGHGFEAFLFRRIEDAYSGTFETFW